MRLLLDTHALLWWWNADRRLSATASVLIGTNPACVSAISAFELATKHRLGKLPQAREAVEDFWALIAADRFEFLPVSLEHGLHAGRYNVDHRDPFDRVLAAQAELDNLVLVTKDDALRLFPCATRW